MIGYMILPFVKSVTGLLGVAIANVTTLQPILMGAIIAVFISVVIILSTYFMSSSVFLNEIGAAISDIVATCSAFSIKQIHLGRMSTCSSGSNY